MKERIRQLHLAAGTLTRGTSGSTESHGLTELTVRATVHELRTGRRHP